MNYIIEKKRIIMDFVIRNEKKFIVLSFLFGYIIGKIFL